MTPCGTCPAHDQLLRFVRGELPEPEITDVERHVETCQHCGDTLAGFQLEATGILNAVAVDSDPAADTDRRMVTELVEKLRDWRPLLQRVDASSSESNRQSAADAVALEAWLKQVLRPAEGATAIGCLGPFVVRRILGVGGMGIVCEAEDPGLKRKVAIKILKPELAASQPARRRFMREAQAAAAIEHGNVVAIHHVGEDSGLPYFAMTLLAGVSLQEYVAKRGPLSEQAVLTIARQILAGLSAAHRHGLIHRDIKPANIFLVHHESRQSSPNSSNVVNAAPEVLQVKLLDFGLARGAEEDPGITDPGVLAGTPSHMSPEQARGLALDPRTDLFSLGCVLYWMTTGKGPFGGPNKTASILAVLEHSPAAPDTRNPAVSPRLSRVVMKLLEKDPGQRYQTAAEVLAALDAPAAATQVAAQEKRSSSAKWGGIVAVVAGLLMAAAIIYVATSKGTLILEVNEPDVVVKVDGTRVQISSPREQIVVSVGDHELQVSKDGFTSITKRFFIQRGGKYELSARLEPVPDIDRTPTVGQETAELIIEVPAIRQWTSTGVAVREGMSLQIAASGSVDAAPETDLREYYQQVPPEGRQERLDHFPAPKLPGLCLMGRIGDGTPFYVGESFSVVAKSNDSSGELFLGINDDIVEDNFGIWKVTIKTRFQKPIK